MTTATKVTISLPYALLERVNEIAKKKRVSRSHVIANLLDKELAELEKEQMIEGYRAFAKENKEFAKRALPLAREVLLEWK